MLRAWTIKIDRCPRLFSEVRGLTKERFSLRVSSVVSNHLYLGSKIEHTGICSARLCRLTVGMCFVSFFFLSVFIFLSFPLCCDGSIDFVCESCGGFHLELSCSFFFRVFFVASLFPFSSAFFFCFFFLFSFS